METHSENTLPSAKPSEKSKDSAEKKVKKVVKKSAKAKTDDLIEKYKNRSNREIGSVVNGDPDFLYVHVGDNSKTKMTVQKLLDVGYELETDPSVVKHGFLGGSLYKIPKEFADHLMKERGKKFRQPRRRRG